MHDNDDSKHYDTSNPNSVEAFHIVSFIQENRLRYKQELTNCCCICICILSIVVIVLLSGIISSIYYINHK